MDALQLTIWAATCLGLAGVAWAFFKSERIGVRLGALGGFALLYFAVILWAPTDELWFNMTTGSVLVIAFASRMKKPTDKPDAVPPAGDQPTATDPKDRPDA